MSHSHVPKAPSPTICEQAMYPNFLLKRHQKEGAGVPSTPHLKMAHQADHLFVGVKKVWGKGWHTRHKSV